MSLINNEKSESFADMPSSQECGEFRFKEVLHAEFLAQKSARKRIRTRYKILLCAIDEIEQSGYLAMTIDAIAEKADVVRSTFYTYFGDKQAVVCALRDLFFEKLRLYRPQNDPNLSAYAAAFQYNSYYVFSFSRNRKLMDAFELVQRDWPNACEADDLMNHLWAERVARDLALRTGKQKAVEISTITLMMVRSAIAMVDRILVEVYIEQSPRFVSLIDNDDVVCELVSYLWYRLLYGTEPPAEELKYFAHYSSTFSHLPST